ncbi:hypothetical protein B7P43_G01291, partial [Cryptotermes secundus]
QRNRYKSRLSQEERSIFWEFILSKNVFMYMCPIPNGFRDRAISLYKLFHCTVRCTLCRKATRHVLTRVTKCTDVDCGLLKNILK